MAEGDLSRPGKVPILASVVAAYGEVFGQTERFLRLAAVPFFASLLLAVPESVGNRFGEFIPREAATAIATLGNFFFTMAFSVRWYRFVLLREPLPRLFGPGFVRYTLLTLLLFAPVSLFAGFDIAMQLRPKPDDTLAELASLAALVFACVAIRFSLAPVAAACGYPMGLGEAWRRLSGNFWRLLLAAFLCSLPMLILLGTVLLLTMRGIGPGTQPTLGMVLTTQAAQGIVLYLILAVSASLIAGFYRHVMATDRQI